MKSPRIPIIDVRKLSHSYLLGTPLEVRSLREIDFQVYEDESVGVTGPNGSGKSTLLHHLNGLVRPQQGDVLIDGVSLSEPLLKIREIRQKIGLVFQNPEDQLFERYAGDDVAFGPRNLTLPAEEVRKRVHDAMEMAGLPFSYKDRLTADLSQGERRRLALAGVFAMNPRVLVLDEPTTSLDPEGRWELIHKLSGWRRERGRSLVVVSHNMEDIVELTDRLYVLVNGKVVLHGSTRDVFSHYELLVRKGLAAPVPAQVMYELNRQGYRVPSGILTIDEAAGVIEEILNG